jgi:hypothetical protein
MLVKPAHYLIMRADESLTPLPDLSNDHVITSN